jgi:hypothetical protein
MRILLLISLLESLFYFSACNNRADRELAAAQIEAMPQGVLLVRLQTSENKIAALEEIGRTDRANATREEQEARNNRTVQAFRQYFDFCPTYFFYAPDSRRVRAGDWQALFDNTYKPVPSDVMKDKVFFVADFGNIEQPSENAGLSALILRDSSFRQLVDPFPFYVQTSTMNRETLEARAVELLNIRLKEYLFKVQLCRRKQEIRQARRALRP